jgi:hypothetical protein
MCLGISIVYRIARCLYIYLLVAAGEVLLNSLPAWERAVRFMPAATPRAFIWGYAIVMGVHASTFIPTALIGSLVAVLRALWRGNRKEGASGLWPVVLGIVAGGTAGMAASVGCTTWCTAGKPWVGAIPEQLTASIELACSQCYAVGAVAFIAVGLVALALGQQLRIERTSRRSHWTAPAGLAGKERRSDAEGLASGTDGAV